MAFQIRATAVFLSVNLVTGVAPGRWFQVSNSWAEGQAAVSFAKTASLLKHSEFRTASAAGYRLSSYTREMRHDFSMRFGTRRAYTSPECEEMKYIAAWALGVPGALVLLWFLFSHH